MSILIVDDTLDHRLLVERLLHGAGYRRTTAVESAAAAFALLGIEPPGPASSPVDVVLLDIMMPEVNGLEASRRIKANRTGGIDCLGVYRADDEAGDDNEEASGA